MSVVIGAGRDGGSVSRPRPRSIPAEERWYVAESGRRVFTIGGLTFGIAICHEAFRYPEIARSLALGGSPGHLRARTS